jgi:hypothetical protein
MLPLFFFYVLLCVSRLATGEIILDAQEGEIGLIFTDKVNKTARLTLTNNTQGAADFAITGLPKPLAQYLAELTGQIVALTGQIVALQTQVQSLQTASSPLENAYPVGAIYTTTAATNPATHLGFGTWQSFGAGRTLVAHDPSSTNFRTVEGTGGQAEVTLTSGQMPRHRHKDFSRDEFWAGGEVWDSGGSRNTGADCCGRARWTDWEGNNEAHTNLQPYIVVYMWKRVS